MRKAWTPSIVPGGIDHNIYLVMDDLGRLGRVWREADAEHTDLETVIGDLLSGQYHDAVLVISFNPHEAGRVMFPRTLRRKSAAAAICRRRTCRQPFRTLSN
jgi:hypothetical protein